MAERKLSVALVTPDRHVADAEVDMVVAPSCLGEVGVLPMHQPLLAELKAGMLQLHDGGQIRRLAVSGGFLEVDRDSVTILAESAEFDEDIDVERAKRAFEGAQGKINGMDASDPRYWYQHERMERARARLNVAESRD